MQLFVTGKSLSDDGKRWAFVGVFDDEAKAVAACEDWTFFVGPVELNSELPKQDIVWPNSYYPKAGKRSDE